MYKYIEFDDNMKTEDRLVTPTEIMFTALVIQIHSLLCFHLDGTGDRGKLLGNLSRGITLH